MHTLTHRHDTQKPECISYQIAWTCLGYMRHLFELETTNSQTLQTGTAVTGWEKSLYKRIALKDDPGFGSGARASAWSGVLLQFLMLKCKLLLYFQQADFRQMTKCNGRNKARFPSHLHIWMIRKRPIECVLFRCLPQVGGRSAASNIRSPINEAWQWPTLLESVGSSLNRRPQNNKAVSFRPGERERSSQGCLPKKPHACRHSLTLTLQTLPVAPPGWVRMRWQHTSGTPINNLIHFSCIVRAIY